MKMVLKSEIQGSKKITHYSEDGVNISHCIEEYIPEGVEDDTSESFSLEDMQMQTLLNTEYLVSISQLNNI